MNSQIHKNLYCISKKRLLANSEIKNRMYVISFND